MKLISFSRSSYLISLALHLSVLISFVYISFESRLKIRSFQTSVFFESSATDKKVVRSSKRPSSSKAIQAESLSKKFNLTPGIKKKRAIVTETEPPEAPSLKKYITLPKSAPLQMEDAAGFLRSNKRTSKPVLPLLSPDKPPEIQPNPHVSSEDPSSPNKSGSRVSERNSNEPFIPNPSSVEADSNKTSSSENRVSSIWQKKSDLVVYRNSLAKLVTANWIVPPTSVKKFQIVIEAHIGPRGNLITIQPIKRSGLAILDAAAERAIRVSTPFPEFPKSFKKDIKSYRAVFRFTPDKVAN